MNAEIKKLLEYQKIEAELIKLDRELDANPNTAVKNKMIAVVKEAQTAAQNLELQAKQSVEEFDKVKAVYEENYKKAEKLNKIAQDLDKLSDEQLLKLNSELENILSNLNIIEKKLGQLNNGVETILERFEKAKQNAYTAKTHYQKAKEALDKASASFAHERAKTEAILKDLAKNIDKTMLAKYKALRDAKVWPVLVRFEDKRCGACRMEQSKSTHNKLSTGGFSECENCHRIICDV